MRPENGNPSNAAPKQPRPSRRKGVTRKCRICKKPFYAKAAYLKRAKAECCSNRCRGILITRQNSVRRKCKQCNKWFSLKRSIALKPGRGQYCSKACLAESLKRRRIVVCKFCQKVFECHECEGVRAFCSKDCTIKGLKAVFLKANCDYCGAEFEYYEKIPTRFCSLVCRKIACSKHAVARSKFKPSFIQFLLEYKGDVCPFVNCGEPPIEMEGLCACKKHIRQVVDVLRCKRRYRDEQLRKFLEEKGDKS
jgi:hypothetical protein